MFMLYGLHVLIDKLATFKVQIIYAGRLGVRFCARLLTSNSLSESSFSPNILIHCQSQTGRARELKF